MRFRKSGKFLLVCSILVAGCTTTESAIQEESRGSLDRAPTAEEMETPLASRGQTAMAPLENGHADRARLADAAAAAPRPVPSFRQLEPTSPIVEDAAEVATSELHGQPLPGPGDIQAPSVATSGDMPPPQTVSAETVEELENRLAGVETELRALDTQAQDRMPVPTEVYLRLEQVENAIEDLPKAPAETPSETVAQLEERIGALHAQYEALESRLAQDTPETLAAYEARLAELEVDMASLDAQAQAAEPVPAEVYERLQQVENALAELPSTPAQAPSDTVAQLEERIAALNAQYETLESRVAQDAPEALAAYEARLAELEADMASVDAQTQAAEPVPAEVYQRLQQVEDALADLPKAPAEAPADTVAQLEERVTALNAQYEALEAQLPKDTPEALAAYEARLAELEASMASLDAQARSAEPVSPELSERLQHVEQTLQDLEESQPQIPADNIAQLEARFAALNAQYETLEARLPESDQLLRRIDVLEQKLAAAAPAEEDNSEQFAAVQSELEALRHLGEQTPDALAAYESRLGAIETSIARLEAREPEVVVRTPEEYAQRLAEVERDLAALETAPVAEAPPSPELLARLDRVEQKLSVMENAPGPVVADVPVSAIEERLSALQAQYEAIEERLPEETEVSRPASAVQPASWTPGAMALTPDFEDYQIGAGDLLEFQSFDDPTLNREVAVRFDGFVSLPLIPDVKVAGATRRQAEDLIRQAYGMVFRRPQLSLLVRTAASKTFTVIGDIAQPGIYPYQQSVTLIDAISQAGGLRNRSSSASGGGGFVGITGQLTKAHIIRFVNGERAVFTYDLRGMGQPGNHSAHVPVYYGDLIYIPEGVNLVYVLGESGNRVIELTEGMTLLQLLSLSGGFNASTARLGDVVLMRQTDEEKSVVLLLNLRKMLRTGEDFKLQPGDIVYIPQKRLVRIEEFVRRFTGSISPFFNLYTSAVDAYYARDLVDVVLQQGETNDTLELLTNIENAGRSGRSIIDLFGNGTPQ